MSKGRSRPFGALAEKNADKVVLEYLKTRMELSAQSLVGEHMIRRFGEVMHDHDQAAGRERLGPGDLLEELHGSAVILPLLPPEAVAGLAVKGSLAEFYAHRELDQQKALHQKHPSATPADLWSLTAKPVVGHVPGRWTQVPETGIERTERLSQLQMPPLESLGVKPRRRTPSGTPQAPEAVIRILKQELAEGFSLRESMVQAVCSILSGIHHWMYPLTGEISPGQVVWLARAIECPRDWCGKVKGLRYLPVVLTHHKPDERPNAFTEPLGFFAQEQERVARMTMEAYVQGGVLSTQDLALLLTRSLSYVRKLLDAYQRRHTVLLPTAGTLLDMGSTLTHKKMAVELHLKGENTTQIARRLFHTEKAIDNYLTVFNKVAMMSMLVTSDTRFIAHVLSISESLVREYVSLIQQYLPDRSRLLQHLQKAGLDLPPPLYG